MKRDIKIGRLYKRVMGKNEWYVYTIAANYSIVKVIRIDDDSGLELQAIDFISDSVFTNFYQLVEDE